MLIDFEKKKKRINNFLVFLIILIMPSRSQKHRTKKQTNNSSIVDNDRFIPSNMNAYNQTTSKKNLILNYSDYLK